MNRTIENKNLITVNACKYDNSIHRSWECELISETNDYWEFVGVFNNEITHNLIGVIGRGTVSYEYYWKRNWFNVFRFHEPDGQFKKYYCNINMPPILKESVLTYIDLDIDVLVAPDFSYQILDTEEFEENAVKHLYPPTVIEKVQASLTDLISLIENRQFPFDFKPDASSDLNVPRKVI